MSTAKRKTRSSKTTGTTRSAKSKYKPGRSVHLPKFIGPPLTTTELGILLLSPYENPTLWSDPTNTNLAESLRIRGLLESDPTARHIYRCTAKATDLIRHYAKLHRV